MNSQDLLNLFGNTKDAYVMEAIASRKAGKQKKVLRLNRIGLIAAIIAAALLLAGCVAVFLRLQDMSIGQATYTQAFDSQGRSIEPTEKTVELFTFFGHGGSPAQLAAKEWYEFSQTYVPPDVGNDPNIADIPDQYEYNYDCVSQEMVDKVDELAAKYNLKLLGTRFGIQTQQSDMAMEAMGISGLFREGAEVKAEPVAGMIYPPSNFRFYIGCTLTGENALWKTPVSGMMFYSRKDFFPLPFYQSFEQGKIQQWEYTAADGTKLLLALADDGYGYIVADLPDAIIGIQLTISLNGYLMEDSPVPTKEVLEQLADVFDYKIQPNVADPDGFQAKLDASNAELQAPPPTEIYSGASAYFEKNAVELRKYDYCSYDMNGDGQEEILIGQSGEIWRTLEMKDDTVQEHIHAPIRLLKNGYLGNYPSDPLKEQVGFSILKPFSATQTVTFNEDGYNLNMGEPVCMTGYLDDGWHRLESGQRVGVDKGVLVTEAEIQAILDEYPTMELPWRPVTEFQLDNGKTIAQLLTELDKPLYGEELKAAYGKLAKEYVESCRYGRFRILDINGDGVEDLLFSGDGLADLDANSTTFYWQALTYRYGTLLSLNASDFYLCEDGVMEHYNWGSAAAWGSAGVDGIREEHTFFRLNDREQEILYSLYYYRATDSWARVEVDASKPWRERETQSPISNAEAEAILTKYPRIDQGMRPVSELIG